VKEYWRKSCSKNADEIEIEGVNFANPFAQSENAPEIDTVH